MPRVRKREVAFGVGLLALLAAQLVPVDRSNPPVQADVPSPPEVKAILQRSCYACHSNRTVWPWYGYVAPASWMLAKDVRDARHELNFSTWKAYRRQERERLLEEILEQIDEGHMPPWYYLLLHPDARVTDPDRGTLRAWLLGHAPAS